MAAEAAAAATGAGTAARQERREKEHRPEPHRIEDCASFPLEGTGWTLQGYSLGGVRTGFRVRELKLLLDAGVASDARYKGVLLTHCHQDHTLALPLCCNVRERHTTVFSNGTCLRLLEPFMRAMEALSDEPDQNELGAAFTAAEPGGPLFAVPGAPDVRVATFRGHHRTASNSYGLYVHKRKLRAAYRGLPGREIGELKRRGEDVTEDVYRPALLFCGDTTSAFFEDDINVRGGGGAAADAYPYPTDIWGFPYVLIECTLLDGMDGEPIGHMDLGVLRPQILAHPSTTFLVMHQSPRYSPAEIVDSFREFPNVVVWHRGEIHDLRPAEGGGQGGAAPPAPPAAAQGGGGA